MSITSIAGDSPAIEWPGPTWIATSGSASGFCAPARECVPSAPTSVAVVRWPDGGVLEAEVLLDRGGVEADLPAHALSAAVQGRAPVAELAAGGLHQLGAHGSITIFSASRRS